MSVTAGDRSIGVFVRSSEEKPERFHDQDQNKDPEAESGEEDSHLVRKPVGARCGPTVGNRGLYFRFIGHENGSFLHPVRSEIGAFSEHSPKEPLASIRRIGPRATQNQRRCLLTVFRGRVRWIGVVRSGSADAGSFDRILSCVFRSGAKNRHGGRFVPLSSLWIAIEEISRSYPPGGGCVRAFDLEVLGYVQSPPFSLSRQALRNMQGFLFPCGHVLA